MAIKPAAPDLSGDFVLGLNAQRAQVHIAWASLLDLVNMGYGVKRYQISGPPGFGNDHFTVDAKIPDGLTRRQVPEMLQSMLDVRFGMKSHWEKKELPGYTLTLTRPDPTLTEVAAPDEQLSVPIGNINNVTHYARPAAPRTTKATARCGSRWSCAEGSFYADVMSVLAKSSPTNNSESPSDLAVA